VTVTLESTTRPRHRLDGVAYRPPAVADRCLATGAWTPASIGDTLRETAREAGSKVALVVGEARLTWADLDDRSEVMAAGLLALGLRPGDRIVVQMGISAETVVTFYACYKAGVVPVCAVPHYRAYEIGALVERSAAAAHIVETGAAGGFDLAALGLELQRSHPTLRHLIVAGGNPPPGAVGVSELSRSGAVRALSPSASPGPEDVAAFQLSGGTTGVPKIIPRFHGEYLASAATWAERIALTEDDVALWALSLSHNAGMILMLLPVLVRQARLVLLPRFAPEPFLSLIEGERVTLAGSIGPIGPKLLQEPVTGRDLSSMRYFFTLNRAAALEAHLGVPAANMFGITEGLLMGSAPGDPAAVRHETVGRPTSAGDEVRVVELGGQRDAAPGTMGELCFRGPSTLSAYYGSEEATREAFTADGFFRTGDLVRAAPHGGVTGYAFEGRAKENIDRGGEKFGVAEIENFLAEHPAITEARVVGMPDPELGERVCAFVIAEPGAAAPGVDEVARFLLARGLAKFKVPERIEVIDEFPITRVGKLDRTALRRQAAAVEEAGD
jgi:non-ribosomal peptide synthetase component E (peptide arylation enzyme)